MNESFENRLTKVEKEVEYLKEKDCDLIKQFENLSNHMDEKISEYLTKIWALVDKMWKGILILVLVIALFAGVKITGLMDLIK